MEIVTESLIFPYVLYRDDRRKKEEAMLSLVCFLSAVSDTLCLFASSFMDSAMTICISLWRSQTVTSKRDSKVKEAEDECTVNPSSQIFHVQALHDTYLSLFLIAPFSVRAFYDAGGVNFPQIIAIMVSFFHHREVQVNVKLSFSQCPCLLYFCFHDIFKVCLTLFLKLSD